jgi:hypothetical protein
MWQALSAIGIVGRHGKNWLMLLTAEQKRQQDGCGLKEKKHGEQQNRHRQTGSLVWSWI